MSYNTMLVYLGNDILKLGYHDVILDITNNSLICCIGVMYPSVILTTCYTNSSYDTVLINVANDIIIMIVCCHDYHSCGYL